jgi:hypothetical protein
MAISLLQNTSRENRDHATTWLESRVMKLNPHAIPTVATQHQGNWMLRLIQKRKTLTEKLWVVIESLRHVPETDRRSLASDLINYIDYLEHEADPEDLFSTNQLEAVL